MVGGLIQHLLPVRTDARTLGRTRLGRKELVSTSVFTLPFASEKTADRLPAIPPWWKRRAATLLLRDPLAALRRSAPALAQAYCAGTPLSPKPYLHPEPLS